jgi:hypothetical protein
MTSPDGKKTFQNEVSKYTYHPTEQFAAKLDNIRRYDPNGHGHIIKVIQRLLDYPSDADGWMHGIHDGRLKKYVGRRDYRLIYRWCEQCRKHVRLKNEHCGSCGQVDDYSVIFYDVYHKNDQAAHLRHLNR